MSKSIFYRIAVERKKTEEKEYKNTGINNQN